MVTVELNSPPTCLPPSSLESFRSHLLHFYFDPRSRYQCLSYLNRSWKRDFRVGFDEVRLKAARATRFIRPNNLEEGSLSGVEVNEEGEMSFKSVGDDEKIPQRNSSTVLGFQSSNKGLLSSSLSSFTNPFPSSQ